MVSLATNAVRTRLALTTFLSNGGEDRRSHVRDLLRQVINSADECGLSELVDALANCEAMLSSEQSVTTAHAYAIDGALRALAPRISRAKPHVERIFDDAAAAASQARSNVVALAQPGGATPLPHAAATVELAQLSVGAAAPASPLELVLLATECASSASASAAAHAAIVEDDFAFNGEHPDNSDTDVDDAPVFEREPSLSLTPPPIPARVMVLGAPATLTPPPNVDIVFVVPSAEAAAPAAPLAIPQAEVSPEPITAVIVPRPAALLPSHEAVYAQQAAFVSAEALQQLLANDSLLAPPGGAREQRDERAKLIASASPFDRVRAAYVVIAILLGLLLGFVTRTMLTASVTGHLAPTLMLGGPQ
jgi:hypothetical protein